MQYAFLIFTDPAASATMTQEEITTLMQGYQAFTQEVMERGILDGGQKLQPPRTATTVRVRNAQTLITEGPFAETKEQLAGFFVLNCNDLDEAVTLAARLPDVHSGSIEVRPVMNLAR